MKLLCFDYQVVNMDLVTEIRVYHSVYLFFANSVQDSSGCLVPDSVELKGEAAAAFKKWLLDNAEFLVAPSPQAAIAPDDDIPF